MVVIPSQALKYAISVVREGVETKLDIKNERVCHEDSSSTVSYKRSLIIGMLLGDSSSRMRKTKSGKLTAEFVVCHSLKQVDLVRWKAMEINRLFAANVVVREYDIYNKAEFSITRSKRIRVVHSWFHRNGEKVITDKIRFMDHPVGIAMLLCDDGSVRKRKKKHKDGTEYYLAPSITIATHSFSKDEVERLLHHIEKLCEAHGYINPERRVRRGKKIEYQRINFNAKNSRVLWHYVSPWIPKVPSMISKFSFLIERYGIN